MRKILLLLALLSTLPAQAERSFLPGACVQTFKDICLDSTPCKKVGGVNACLAGTRDAPTGAVVLKETCWQYQAAFTCTSGGTVDSCAPLAARGCAEIGQECVSHAADGRCLSAAVAYQCPDKPSVSSTRNVCAAPICDAGAAGCFDTSRPPNTDFGRAAAMMEAVREAGVYGFSGGTIELFKGYQEQCSIKTIGGATLRSCCKPGSGGINFTNFAVIGLTAKAAYAVGKEEIKAGSQYVYDALFSRQDPALIKKGMDAAASGLSDGAVEGVAAQGGTNFGTYGFQFSYSSAGGFEYVGFDPTSFAIGVAVALVTEWLGCDHSEQVMQLKNGQNLCTYLNSYCASSVLGVCIERKERHCCFNSVLAKLINRQGRAQLGLSMDSCGGFTEEQLTSLDFSRFDLSEFIASIAPKDIDIGEMEKAVGDSVKKKVELYYGN